MVVVQEKLYVSAEDFFNCVAESVAYDIADITGKRTRVSQIHKGFTYTKVMKNKVKRKGDVKVTITEWNPPKEYSAIFDSVTGQNTLSYKVEDLEDGYIGVTYKEDFMGSTKGKDLNFKLVNLFYKKKATKRAVKLLRAIEKYVQEEKGRKEIEKEQEQTTAIEND